MIRLISILLALAGFAGAAPAGFRLQSPFTLLSAPTNISGVVLWLDASQITGLADGDPVASWTDLSGSGNSATQATASLRPTFQTSELNGKPGVLSDGTNDLLSGPLTAPQPCTVIIVARGATASAKAYRFLITPQATRCDLFNRSGTSARLFAGSEAGGPAWAWQSPAIMFGLFDGASSLIYLNGGSPTTVNPGTGGYTSGNYNLFDFDGTYGYGDAAFIFEVIVYSRKLTQIEVSQVRGYLNNKWSVY
jgi:hypothetical protein